MSRKRDRAYLRRTIAAIRQHGDKCSAWAKAGNLLADEVERLWAQEEQTRQALADVKRYAVYHGLPISECVAWAHLKEAYGVEQAYEERGYKGELDG